MSRKEKDGKVTFLAKVSIKKMDGKLNNISVITSAYKHNKITIMVKQ